MGVVEITPRPDGVPADLGKPELPGSKSHAQRALLLAAGGARPVLLRGAPTGGDTAVMVAALRALGATIDEQQDGWRVGGACSWRGSVHLGENGTALRTLPLVAAMLGGQVTVDGDDGLRRRPVDAVWDLLAQAGVGTSAPWLPWEVDGGDAAWPDTLRVDAGTTTQPASGALLGLALRARRDGGEGTLKVDRPVSAGYLRVTAAVLSAWGFAVEEQEIAGGIRFVVRDTGEPPREYSVPPDASATAFPSALAAVHGLEWAVPLPAADDDLHPDHAFAQDLRTLAEAPPGAPVSLEGVASHPDSFPALCVVAAARSGGTTVAGAPALRAKESDRIAAMAALLRGAGAACDELDDGVVIRGPLPSSGERRSLPTVPDHRVVMAGAVLATALPGGGRLEHSDAVEKSWSGFFAWLGRVADLRWI